ncbi:GfV-A6-ORF1 [Ichnoviriform fumiferanae]|uniref:GfV-A6-ORF1 n=1 Tax=Ichnoviriform fumiferanae TaxID=419435 RepID=A2PZP9_9VIRU|nr:GfV-A6-ORF1 [Ichnoviriform fumiferanae]BAF45471.1 GfV-A6-ORF1 [Ichnoviriform fumiferanae]
MMWLSSWRPFRPAVISLPNSLSIQAFSDPKNRMKNRHSNIPCWDHSRVILSESDDFVSANASDYIHANYVRSLRRDKISSLPKRPMDETIDDFFDMITQQNSRIIVVLTKIIENNEEKCYPYWSMKTNEIRKTRKYIVEVKEKFDKSGYMKYILRLINIKSGKNNGDISLFHYIDWPHNDIPQNVLQFLNFIKAINDEEQVPQQLVGHNLGPIVVHGSAGVGRTVSFCVIILCIDLSFCKIRCKVDDVLEYVWKMRYSDLPTVRQCEFIHFAIRNFIMLNKKIVC